MFVADVYDVASSSSAVSVLHEHGIDPWVVDFGAPEREDGWPQRNLADHVVAVSEAVDRVRELRAGETFTSADTPRAGCSPTQVAAYRRGEGLAPSSRSAARWIPGSRDHVLVA